VGRHSVPELGGAACRTQSKRRRALVERERWLLGILSRSAYESLRRTYAAYFGRDDATPGVIASIQTL
jgi:hypothetical protein